MVATQGLASCDGDGRRKPEKEVLLSRSQRQPPVAHLLEPVSLSAFSLFITIIALTISTAFTEAFSIAAMDSIRV